MREVIGYLCFTVFLSMIAALWVELSVICGLCTPGPGYWAYVGYCFVFLIGIDIIKACIKHGSKSGAEPKPDICSICAQPIESSTFIDTGNGDGNSFAHECCYRARDKWVKARAHITNDLDCFKFENLIKGCLDSGTIRAIELDQAIRDNNEDSVYSLVEDYSWEP